MELSYLAAFVVGLLGGVHCIGMCGGIVGALSFGLPEPARGRLGAMLPYLLNYNLGRLFSYALAGALLGGIGTLAAQLLLINQAQLVLQVVAGLFMIALGLYLGGWWFGITRLERLGSGLWSRLEPHARKLLPVRSPTQALLMGLVWGWLPCGLVYSMLIMAISAGSALDGALLLLSFGLGTLPNLLLMGVAAGKLTSLMRRPAVRRIAGTSVILIGLYYISRPLLH
ncbi:MAG: sulfite exporter TauE/SafE family protein [Thiohalomonadaceae bacterium]